MKTSFIQFLLIFSVLSLLFFPQTSVQGAKMGWFYGLQRSHQLFYLFYCSLVLCNITKRSIWFPGSFTPQKLFLVSMRTFLHLYSRFLWMSLGAKIIDDFISCGSFTKSEGEKLLYTCNQISPMFSAGYTLTLILHGKISALRFFFCLYFPVMCYLIYLIFFIFYKRFSTYAPLFSHHCTQKVSRSGNLW